jgi:hypothetical protein
MDAHSQVDALLGRGGMGERFLHGGATADAASVGTIEVDAYVDDMAISPDGRRLYVISSSGDALEAVDTGTA